MIDIKDDPLFRRLRQHAEKRIQFSGDVEMEERMEGYKEYLRLENEMLERYHRKGDSGLRVARSRAVVIDVLIENLFQTGLDCFFKKTGNPPLETSIVATGGYGRAELNPYSDIDIMFLYPDKLRQPLMDEFREVMTSEMLYPMWDMGLKVGHSSRTVNEVIEESRAEIATKNSILEARAITGSVTLFGTLTTKFDTFLKKQNVWDNMRQQMDERMTRLKKMGNTVFLQAPEIKNGVGGLRDYQSVLWMARVTLGLKNLEEIEAEGLLKPPEASILLNAYDFLHRVRNELHFISSRPVDTLFLEKQGDVAANLGYEDEDVLVRVERFMREYYGHAQGLHKVSSVLERRIGDRCRPSSDKMSLKRFLPKWKSGSSTETDGFILEKGSIRAENDEIFKEDPNRLIRVFRHCQSMEVSLSPDLEELIRDSLSLITKDLINDKAANRSFRSIIQTTGAVFPVLMDMYNLGVLGRFIPEFGKLFCIVRHEYYHRYTADIHLLHGLRELDKIFAGEGEEERKYREVLRQTRYPSLLYLILLLHEVGLGEDDEVSIKKTVEVSKEILERLGVHGDLSDEVLFIIENQNEMARYSQKFDIDDTDTYVSFVDLVKDSEVLRYLYVFTYCDTLATTASLWTSYKQLLHDRMYDGSLKLIEHSDQSEIMRKRKEDLRKLLEEGWVSNIAEDEIDAHFELLPDRYFNTIKLEEVELHIRMVNELLTTIMESDSVGSLTPIFDWRNDKDQGLTVVNVVTWDRAGLFYKLSGALSVAGLNIVSSRVISRQDHITIDTFYVVKSDGGVADSVKYQETFEKYLNLSLMENRDLWPDIQKQAKGRSSLFKSDSEKLGATVSPVVDVYHEVSLRRMIIELQASDAVGLLYCITKAIFEAGFDITFARVATENTVAIDTFYIEPVEEGERDRTKDLLSLRESLNEILKIQNESRE